MCACEFSDVYMMGVFVLNGLVLKPEEDSLIKTSRISIQKETFESTQESFC